MKKFIVYTTVYRDYFIEVDAENAKEAHHIVENQSVEQHEKEATLSDTGIRVDNVLEKTQWD